MEGPRTCVKVVQTQAVRKDPSQGGSGSSDGKIEPSTHGRNEGEEMTEVQGQ